MKTVLVFIILIAATQAFSLLNLKRLFEHNKPSVREERIINGTEAVVGQFPYQAGIFLDFVGFCGGSLISESVVLTAAHCVSGTVDFTVYLGVLKISNETEEGRLVISTRNTAVNPEYDVLTRNNDIALLYLNENAAGPNIAPIRLPAKSHADIDFTGTQATISGWGQIEDSSELGPVDMLSYVDVILMDNNDCSSFYEDIIQPCHICFETDLEVGTRGMCDGDEGGPLVILEEDEVPTQLAVLSFRSVESCLNGYPQGASRLTCQLEWIGNNTGIPIRD